MRNYSFLILLSLILFSFINTVSGQNLILNGDFEDLDTLCQTSWGLISEKSGLNYEPITCIQPWGEYSNTQLVFYFNGFIKSGYSAASVKLYKKNSSSKSYLMTVLNTAMEKDSFYLISFVCRVLNPGYTTNALHIAFSDTLLPFNNYATLDIPYAFKMRHYISDTAWEKIIYVYQATGYEKMIVIGNVSREKPKIRSRIKIDNFSQIDCLIDELSIFLKYNNYKSKVVDPIPKLGKVNSNTSIFIPDIPFTINKIYFENNSSRLLPSSSSQLFPIIEYLWTNTSAKLRITGYTDSIGNAMENLQLSIMRAKTIADELVKSHINLDRIIVEGMGEKNPIATNDTEIGRRKNRRVEFLIE